METSGEELAPSPAKRVPILGMENGQRNGRALPHRSDLAWAKVGLILMWSVKIVIQTPNRLITRIPGVVEHDSFSKDVFQDWNLIERNAEPTDIPAQLLRQARENAAQWLAEE